MIYTDILIIGGSDAGISAGLRARELDKNVRISVILADEYPNLSICGIPYAVGREVENWQSLAHRTITDLEAYNISFYMNTVANEIKPNEHVVIAKDQAGENKEFTYKKLIVGTGAIPANLPSGLPNGVHVLHTMSDYFAIEQDLEQNSPKKVAIVGAGYVGLEMAEALQKRGVEVTIVQRGKEVLSTIENDLAKTVSNELRQNNINVLTDKGINSIEKDDNQLNYYLAMSDGTELHGFEAVILVIGVVPNTKLLEKAGAKLGVNNAVLTNEKMETNLQDVYAAGDLIVTKHRLLGDTYLPLGTTAHKQGRIAGANAVGNSRTFKGILGSQVLRVFDLIIARTGILPSEALDSGYTPVTVTSVVDDHKAYIPGSKKITIRLTADKSSRRIIGAQLIGHFGSEVAKRADVFSTAIYNNMTVDEFSDLDLTYSPIVGAPWDAVQAAAQKLELELNK